MGHILNLSGASGSGKTTLTRALVAVHPAEYAYVPSITTRPARGMEEDKIIVTPDEFAVERKAGNILCVNTVLGFLYGIRKNSIVTVLQTGRTPILDVRADYVPGLRDSAKDIGAVATVYLRPPSLGVLRKRLAERNLPDALHRLHRDIIELEELERRGYRGFDIVLTTDDIGRNVDEIHGYLSGKK